ncbi:putative small auxin-up RNA [Rosa chinensis]|uniref:Putative small auxin-up RNA n=1 Tax=Rosa chinensis TaxID=74649 RepID=A0A2P6PJB9_ROSCH|nr:auxin-induced protein 15A [Rosa chinensis]PRQ22027.1 putative small auxin-up RNA [Rosa chinensis]
MGPVRLPSLVQNVKQILRVKSHNHEVPKGHVAVYVGEQIEKKRYVVSVSYLNHLSFKDLLKRAEDEFGFNHPMGGLTIPCREETFFDLIAPKLGARILS